MVVLREPAARLARGEEGEEAAVARAVDAHRAEPAAEHRVPHARHRRRRARKGALRQEGPREAGAAARRLEPRPRLLAERRIERADADLAVELAPKRQRVVVVLEPGGLEKRDAVPLDVGGRRPPLRLAVARRPPRVAHLRVAGEDDLDGVLVGEHKIVHQSLRLLEQPDRPGRRAGGEEVGREPVAHPAAVGGGDAEAALVVERVPRVRVLRHPEVGGAAVVEHARQEGGAQRQRAGADEDDVEALTQHELDEAELRAAEQQIVVRRRLKRWDVVALPLLRRARRRRQRQLADGDAADIERSRLLGAR